MGYFRILAAVPGFFLSSLFVMLFSRVIGPRLGVPPVDYVFAMLITIALWLAVAPLAARTSWWWPGKRRAKSGMPWMGGMMSRMMPMMMERWFSNMDPEARKKMSGMCPCMGEWGGSSSQREGANEREEADPENTPLS